MRMSTEMCPAHTQRCRAVLLRSDVALEKSTISTRLKRKRSGYQDRGRTSDASSPTEPSDSTAIGVKLYSDANDRYFSFFCLSASFATAPGLWTARFRWLAAKVSRHVKSHTKQRPFAQGRTVRPNKLCQVWFWSDRWWQLQAVINCTYYRPCDF